MSIDITSLSAKELDALINQAKKRKTTLNKRKPIATVRSKLTQLARAEGYTIVELFGGGPATRSAKPAAKTTPKKARKAMGKVAPKYRNPANPAETWTGRGKQPRWLAAHTAAGRGVEEFLIR
ncbi:H-NS histone family protein [Lysobacter sp. S4-A87]|uniref:H-NS histone family protein n=1 Tax=Lysobacter sp. S4-A87 TaxID=2925843 RepID=UPI001F539D7D|nr:H-NS histone family protein [Lysobacter sp. S4-A87]UNK48905.1 H-NS histone family protein [Lysobacter sp. S4-A87]